MAAVLVRLLGACLVVAGVALVCLPAAVVLAGVVLLVVGHELDAEPSEPQR